VAAAEGVAKVGSPTRAVALTGLAVAVLSLVSIAKGPSFLSPWASLALLPAIFLSPIAALMPAVLFWAWVPHLFRGETVIPSRSAVMLGVLTVLTPIWFVIGWDYGVRFQGSRHTVSMACLNALILVATWYLLRRGRNAPSFRASLRFHAALFAWLAWAAFPHLGEFP
jgi:hypothetical protein